MGLIVQKFGGTSVATIAHMLRVAEKIKASKAAGHDIVVVVSAMGKETDRLDSLAYEITDDPSLRELNVLLAAGEQVSIALLSMALQSIGVPAVSYTGFQVPIYTDKAPTKAGHVCVIQHNRNNRDRAQTIHVGSICGQHR